MTFAARLARAPRASNPDRGAEVAATFPELAAEIRELIAGTAGSSPYLESLLTLERDWIGPALVGAPEDAFDAVLADVQALDPAALKPGLRQAKRRVALLAALADLGGVWPLETVTGALTRLADMAVDRAARAAIAREVDRGKIPGLPDGSLGGYTVLAMGKMGAFELNYSSDIDLICLFDETCFDPTDFAEARAGFIRATRTMAAMLSDRTADGYVFRTDLRLRPDPSVTPVCLGMEAAERYYESLGRTWERAAYIKARAAAGDIAAGERFLNELSPFVWRRHLDYAAIQDAHDMRLRIRDHKGLHGRDLPGHDMKLGSGGIREIEFFTQTRQIIAGGRDPRLRLRGTVEGLQALTDTGWEDEAANLIPDYRAHREVEHRLQMIADQQTHTLPTTDEGFDRLAALMDRDADDLKAEISDRLARVANVTEGFFKPAGGAAPEAPKLSDTAWEIVSRWHGYPALRSARAVEIFDRVRPKLLARLAQAARPDEALTHIDGFLKGLPAGVQLFSLFEANPQLIDLIVDIASTAPDLASYLSRNAGVLDAVIGGVFFADWPGEAGLTRMLTSRLAAAGDYEAQLDAARICHREWHFRIGVHHLRGLIDGAEAGRHYADLAGAVLAALWPVAMAAFAEKHGPPPGRGAAVLGMGSLGARQLNAKSDLDLIVVYDAEGVDESDGRRPLATRTYYARLTQAFVTALSAPMAEGRLYEVDMRLRPSGRQGPVATSLASFTTYQREEAWTWEHLALTRARAVAGTVSLGEEIEEFRQDLLAGPRDRAKVLGDVAEMRARLAGAKPGAGPWDVKSGPGRLQDIALLAQAGSLLAGAPARGTAEQLAAGQGALGLTKEDARALTQAEATFWAVQAAARLMTGGPLDPAEVGAGGAAFLLRETGAEDIDALEAQIGMLAETAAAIVAQVVEGQG
jgi:glutamate-ammonia-ligase adenylyltransferase